MITPDIPLQKVFSLEGCEGGPRGVLKGLLDGFQGRAQGSEGDSEGCLWGSHGLPGGEDDKINTPYLPHGFQRVSFKGCAWVRKGVMKGGCEGGPRGGMKGVLERFRRVSVGVSEGFPKGFPKGFHGFPGVSARSVI